VDVRVDEVGGPAEVLGLDVLGRKADFDAVRFHLRDVAVFGDLAADTLGRDRADQVEVVAFVPVEGQVDPVVDEPDVESEVQLVLLLVGELRIFEARNLETGFGIAAGRTPRGRGFDDGQRVGDVRRAAVGGQRVGGFERQVRQGGLYVAEELLLVDVPCPGDIPRRQPAGFAALAHLVGPFVAVGSVDGVASLVRIGSIEEEGHFAIERVADRVVLAAALHALLEGQVIVVRLHTHIVLESPAAEPGVVPVDLVHRHTAVEADDMRVVERFVVGRRRAEVVRKHFVVRAFVDTALGQHGHRNGVGVVRIGVKERVVVPDGGRFDGPVSDGLV